ncbi:hypothetical protein ACOTVS_09980 [Aliarcobacter butzleri]|uniref:hypothetical protein n=1 Tax=Aliarcobacter butzleri TaxID=28197 RepID=UPI00344B19FC
MSKKPLYIFEYFMQKYPKTDFIELMTKVDNTSRKLPEIKKIRESDWTLAKYKKINPGILKDKLNMLFDVLIEKGYKNIEKIKIARDIINNEDMRYYSQQQYFKFCYSDDFSTLYLFYYNDTFIQTIKNYKKWTFDREYSIFCLLDAIINKYNYKNREKEYFSRIKNIKKLKNKLFIVEVDFIGYNLDNEWAMPHNEKIYLIISDINKAAVLKRISDDGKKANSIINNLSSRKCHQGSIKSINFLDLNSENIQKAKECIKNKHTFNSHSYDKWICFSQRVHNERI